MINMDNLIAIYLLINKFDPTVTIELFLSKWEYYFDSLPQNNKLIEKTKEDCMIIFRNIDERYYKKDGYLHKQKEHTSLLDFECDTSINLTVLYEYILNIQSPTIQINGIDELFNTNKQKIRLEYFELYIFLVEATQNKKKVLYNVTFEKIKI